VRAEVEPELIDFCVCISMSESNSIDLIDVHSCMIAVVRYHVKV